MSVTISDDAAWFLYQLLDLMYRRFDGDGRVMAAMVQRELGQGFNVAANNKNGTAASSVEEPSLGN